MVGRVSSRVCWKSLAHGLWPVIVFWGGAALADPPANGTQTDGEAVRSAPVSRPIEDAGLTMRYDLSFVRQLPPPTSPEARTGETLPLSLQDATQLALLNNREIKIDRLTFRTREQDIRRERAAFHPTLSIDGSGDRSEGQTANLLAGTENPTTANLEWNAGIRTKLIMGTVVSVDFKNKRSESNSQFQTLDPQYASSLGVTVTQPLLKDLGTEINATKIRVAENSLGMSRHQLKLTVTNVLFDVEAKYWDLVLALRDVEIKRQSLDLARQLARRTAELVAEGRLPETALLQANVAILDKDRDVVLAENVLRETRSRLRDTLNLDPGTDPTIVPLDQPTADIREVDVGQVLKGALANRPEVPQLRLDLQNRDLALRFAKNQALPQLNFFGSYGLSGIAGSPESPCPDPRVRAIIAVCAPPENLGGGYGTALENLFSGDSPAWKVGINLTIPLGNVAARSELRKAELELEKAEVALKSLEGRIALEVEKVAYQIRATPKIVEGTRALREQAQRRLEMTREQFELGLAPLSAVMEAQNEVASAKLGELKAIVDYNKLLALLDKATGATLEKFRVEL